MIGRVLGGFGGLEVFIFSRGAHSLLMWKIVIGVVFGDCWAGAGRG